MKVKCPQCASIYRVSDDSIPETGIQMRCSKCKNIFSARKRSKKSIQRLREKKLRLNEKTEPVTSDIPTKSEAPLLSSSVDSQEKSDKPTDLTDVRLGSIPPPTEDAPNTNREIPVDLPEIDLDEIESSLRQEASMIDEIESLIKSNDPENKVESDQTVQDSSMHEQSPQTETPAPSDNPEKILSTPPAPSPATDSSTYVRDDIENELKEPSQNVDHTPQDSDEIEALKSIDRSPTSIPSPTESVEDVEDVEETIVNENKEPVEEPDTQSEADEEPDTQSEADDLFANAKEAASEPDKEPDTQSEAEPSVDKETVSESEDLLDQDELDNLLAGGGEEEAPENEESEFDSEEDTISQDDIDSLFTEAEEQENVKALEDEDTQTPVAQEDELEQPEEQPPEVEEEELPVDDEPELPEEDDIDLPGEEEPEQADEASEEIEPVEEKIPSFMQRLRERITQQKILGNARKAVAGIAAVVALGLVGGSYWFFYGGSGSDVTQAPIPATAPGQQTASVEPDIDDSLMAEESETEDEMVVKVNLALPVEFDNDSSKLMSMEFELAFDTQEVATSIGKKTGVVVASLEKNINLFFDESFSEQTFYINSALEEFLQEKLGSATDFAGLQNIRITHLSFL